MGLYGFGGDGTGARRRLFHVGCAGVRGEYSDLGGDGFASCGCCSQHSDFGIRMLFAPCILQIFFASSTHADVAAVSLWLVLRNSIRAGGALNPVRQYSLVSEQVRKSGLTASNFERCVSHLDLCMLPAHMGLLSDRRIFPRCVDGASCPEALWDRVQLLAVRAAFDTETSGALVASCHIYD